MNGDDSGVSRPCRQHGYFFVGGRYDETPDGRFMRGQMYVEFFTPQDRTQALPIVMFSGGGQSGLNYTGTPDGRDGWAQIFLGLGYEVYVVDQPSRARSPHHADTGAQSRHSVARVQQQFTAPKLSKLWPQAELHTQWPGSGVEGDPVFDQFYAQNFPSLASFPHQQALNRDAGAALLDRIGPAVLLTHSQSGAFGWLVADARPGLVKAIVAMEPSGPPVRDLVMKGAPDWFEDGPLTKPYGLTAAPLTYDPPLESAEELRFVLEESAAGEGLARCWLQAEPARQLAHLRGVPVLVAQGEASYHAPYDHGTVAYLRQAGVEVDYVRLADRGITGNGHMMMLELNNREIAHVAHDWLTARLPNATGAASASTSR